MKDESKSEGTRHSDAGSLTADRNETNNKQPSRIFKAVFPGKYIQGENALLELPGLIELFGQNCLILASPAAKNKILPANNIKGSGVRIHVEEFHGECHEKN